jgi:hypothetical protein
MAISAEPFSPYTIPRHGSLSQFAIGWNAHLRGEYRDDLSHQWQKEGWDAALEYVNDLNIPVPCPTDFVRYPRVA